MVCKIIDNGEEINRIVADEAFISAYTAETGYTAELIEPEPEPEPQPEPEPTELERLRADVDYLLMMQEA